MSITDDLAALTRIADELDRDLERERFLRSAEAGPAAKPPAEDITFSDEDDASSAGAVESSALLPLADQDHGDVGC